MMSDEVTDDDWEDLIYGALDFSIIASGDNWDIVQLTESLYQIIYQTHPDDTDTSIDFSAYEAAQYFSGHFTTIVLGWHWDGSKHVALVMSL